MSKTALGDSPLFDIRDRNLSQSMPSVPKENDKKLDAKVSTIHNTAIPENHDTMPPLYDQALVALIRKRVKEYGKEAATFRFTQDEKRTLREIIYKFSTCDIQTSENEITRISINFIFENFKRFGKDSVLQLVIDALNG